MDKILEKYHNTNNQAGITAGLLAAQALCSRKLLECDPGRESDIVLGIMAQILELIAKAARGSIEDMK